MPTWVEDFARDVSHGLRTLRRTPAFTAVALLTLALGIGANTAIFSVVNGVILRPLGYPKPEQLMRLTSDFPGIDISALSMPEYVEFRTMTRTFAAVGAFAIGGTLGNGNGAWSGAVNLTAGDRPLRVRSALVDEHLLAALGVRPAHGRLFGPGETDATGGLGGPPIAILSHELWQTAFGGQPLVGRTVDVDGRPHQILGIMPPGVDVMDHRTQIWLPLGVHPAVAQQRGTHMLSIIGRLEDGVTPEAAQTELSAFLENWGERTGNKGHVPTTRPVVLGDHLLRLAPLQQAIVGDARRAIWVLQGAVGLVLLIACANLANLIMARAESRRGEFAVRAALGATRGRLLRQTMTEGVLLSVAGGVLGLGLARAGVQALIFAYPTSLPRTSEVAIDVPVLLFALGVSIATGVLFGLAPAAQRRARDLVMALKEAGERGGSGGARHHVRRGLVVAEIALAVMLVTGAGLLVRTVYNLARVDAGFDRSRLVTFSITLPPATSYEGGRARAYQRLVDALRGTPGVQAATAMSDLPLERVVQAYGTGTDDDYLNADGRPVTVVDYYQFVMSDYFKTMGIPIVTGRGFEPTDTVSGSRVVVVNETLANTLWNGQDPIGRRLRPTLSGTIGTVVNPWHTVIGVAKDVKEGGVDRETGTELYLFVDQPGPPIDGTPEPWVVTAPRSLHMALRTNLPPAVLSQTLERVVREVDPAVPVVRLREMDAVFTESIRQPRLLAQLLGAFAGLALLLAAIGTYGVLSYMVAERRREIGVRMALGAARGSVVALVMKQGLLLTIVGVAVGLAGAFGLNRLVASLLFGVQPTDPATLAATTTTITLVAVAACALPAWRAAMVPPMVAMRDQPQPVWRAAGLKVRRTIREMAAGSERPVASSTTLITEFTGMVQRAASFSEALHVALPALRERAGAEFIMLLEKVSADEYRNGDCSIPARGILVNRLTHYPHPLPLTAGDFQAWLHWAREFRPEHVAEIERLTNTGARIAVALRTRREIVGVLLLGPPDGRDAFTDAEKQLLSSAAELFALMIENARLNDRALEQEKVRRDLALAAEVQRRLLPPQPPCLRAATLAAFTLPARSVGGDFYDFVELPDEGIGIAVADIAGKGIAAALLTSVVQASLRVISAEGDIAPSQLAARMNRFLYRSTAANNYATFFYAQLDASGRRLRYVNAGHNPPYLVRRTETGVTITELSVGGTVLGLFPDVDYEDAEVTLCPGDLFVAFTDGLTEARSASDEEFGEDTLKDLLRGAVGASAEEVSWILAAEMRKWIAGAEQHDDLTFVVATVK